MALDQLLVMIKLLVGSDSRTSSPSLPRSCWGILGVRGCLETRWSGMRKWASFHGSSPCAITSLVVVGEQAEADFLTRI